MTKAEAKKFALIMLKYTAFFACVTVLWFARVEQSISPFAIALLFASLYLPINKWVATAGVFGLSMFADFSHTTVVANAFACGVFIIFALLFKQYKKNLAKKRREQEDFRRKNGLSGVERIPAWKKHADVWMVLCAFVISQGLTVFYAVRDSFAETYLSLISVLVGCVFLFCLIILVGAARTRRGRIPWTIDQKICLAVFVVVFALGLGGVESDYFSLHKFVTILIILVGVFYFSPKETLIVAICMGLGRSLIALNLNFVAIYALLACVVIAFRARRPYYSCVALVLTDVVLGTYFDAYLVYNLFSLIPVFLAIAVFLAVPRKFYAAIDFNFYHLGHNLVSKNTINQNRHAIYNRLSSLGAVFGEMGNIYRGMIAPTVSTADSARQITAQVLSTTCANCPNKPTCQRTHDDSVAVHGALCQMTETGLVRGAVNFLEAPPVLAMKCGRLNTVISAINNLVEGNHQKRAQAKTLDNGKVLMGGLLNGVGQLCESFAKDLTKNIVFDNDKAELIAEELLFKNIVVSDCLITKQGSEYSVSILVPRTSSTDKNIEKIIGKVCGHKMAVESIAEAQTAGFSIVTIKTAPRYAVSLGVAQIAKGVNQTCGDTYTILKIDSEKTMVAVCDGMGAGETAKRASTLALSLVENFYRAHFPSEVIMTSVNQLLTITGGEVFSALDIAVFDLGRGEVDFIKVGACDGFIKRDNETEVIEAGSLPLGILDEMKPKITHAVLNAGDYIVLASDGILDAFVGDRFGLANYINNLTPKTPQQLADEIMHEALNRAGRVAPDDCTVVVGKLV